VVQGEQAGGDKPVIPRVAEMKKLATTT
jgi:hypothetical protein